MRDDRLIICAVASVLLHFAISRGLDELPPYTMAVPRHVEVTVLEPPPPEPPPEPEKPPEVKPDVVPHEAPRPHAQAPQRVAAAPKDTPPPVNPAVTTETTDEPVYGATMESTSTVGTGPAVPVGNTTRAPAETGSGASAPRPLAEPVAAFEATKMPLPEGRCSGKYTDDARAAGVEGTVVLDLIVGEDGRAREIHVTSGVGHGLDEAAIAALRACHFTPGEKDGKSVPVRIRGFKIQFVLQEAQ